MNVALVTKDLLKVKSQRTTKLDIGDVRTEIEKRSKKNALLILCGDYGDFYIVLVKTTSGFNALNAQRCSTKHVKSECQVCVLCVRGVCFKLAIPIKFGRICYF
jgi:hypothetical protein